MNRVPWLWLLAGPNGGGKSTTARELLADVDEILNPDEIALSLNPSDPREAALRAGAEAIRRTRSLLQARKTFARETTLSGRTIFSTIDHARDAGYRVGVIYVGLRSAELAIQRVHLRVKKGGHDVPVADISRRYSRSLTNLPRIVAVADRMYFFDNSRSRPIMVMETRKGKVTYRNRVPAWLNRALNPAGKRTRRTRRR